MSRIIITLLLYVIGLVVWVVGIIIPFAGNILYHIQSVINDKLPIDLMYCGKQVLIIIGLTFVDWICIYLLMIFFITRD